MIVKVIGAGPDVLGEVYQKDQDEFVIALDGGITIAERHGLHIDAAFSDGDSSNLTETQKKYPFMRVFSPIKDEADFDLALDALEKGELVPCEDIACVEAYGVLGRRLDHTLAALCALKKHPTLPLHLRDSNNDVYLGIDEIIVSTGRFKFFSLFSFEETIVTIKSAKYPLYEYHLFPGDNLCLSNEVMGHEATVYVNHPVVMIESGKREQ